MVVRLKCHTAWECIHTIGSYNFKIHYYQVLTKDMSFSSRIAGEVNNLLEEDCLALPHCPQDLKMLIESCWDPWLIFLEIDRLEDGTP